MIVVVFLLIPFVILGIVEIWCEFCGEVVEIWREICCEVCFEGFRCEICCEACWLQVFTRFNQRLCSLPLFVLFLTFQDHLHPGNFCRNWLRLVHKFLTRPVAMSNDSFRARPRSSRSRDRWRRRSPAQSRQSFSVFTQSLYGRAKPSTPLRCFPHGQG